MRLGPHIPKDYKHNSARTVGALNAATYAAGSKALSELIPALKRAKLEPTQLLLYKPEGKSSRNLSLANFQLVDIDMREGPNTHILGIISQDATGKFYVTSTSSGGATSNGRDDLRLVQNVKGRGLITASIDQEMGTMRILDSQGQSFGALGLRDKSGARIIQIHQPKGEAAKRAA